MNSLFILFQHLVPQHLLSRLTGWFAGATSPWLKNLLVKLFIRRYGVDMDEALHGDPEDYATFNDFFTRALKPGARPMDESPGSIVSPADGNLVSGGDILADTLLQAKGKSFSLTALLGGDDDTAAPFLDGSFMTAYLSPKDYHRVHMPCGGTLRRMIYIPGRLFSVNQVTSERIDDLFARNERAVCLFDTDAGPMALVLVGAMVVAGIETVWSGQVAPSRVGPMETDYTRRQPAIQLRKGEEMGRFKLGSTVIVLFGPGAVRWQDKVTENREIRMGETLGTLTTGA